MRKDLVQFVRAALKNPLEVSTIFPTSRALALRLLERLPSHDLPVIELGTGTGAITRYLDKALKDPARYLGIEINPDMVSFMRKAYPHLRFERCAANQIGSYCSKNQTGTVVSSLPWTMFAPAVRESTLNAIHATLAPGGHFLTYMCINVAWSPAARSFSKLLRQKFSRVDRLAVEWRNVPPAFVYDCQK